MYKYLFFVFLLATTKTFSQILFDEKFDDNKSGWLLANNDQCNSKIGNGYYSIESKSGGWDFIIPVGMDPEKDFVLETKIAFQNGDGAYGLVIKDYRKSNDIKEYAFIISPSGSFKIFVWNVTLNTSDIICDWKSSSSINTGISKENKLSIEKKGKKYSFLINGNKIFESNSIQFSGAAAGFVTYAPIHISVDYLSIQQDRGQINTVAMQGAGYIKENLGPKINSLYNEIVPVVSPDGKTIYFNVLDDPKNIGLGDIWFSHQDSKQEWGYRENIGTSLNTIDNNSVVSVQPDNNTLLLAGEYTIENGSLRTYLGLSITHRTKEGWSMPEKMTIKNMYNLAPVHTYCVSPDGKVLIIAEERENTFGYTDLYVSFLEKGGSWSEPKNMGNILNSFGEEATPFIGADGKTLYFSSDGLLGYGRHDIFLSKRLDDSWTKWSTPQNLGPDINTKGWDAYYTSPASGEYAYLVSTDNSIGANDIFRIKLQQAQKPDPVVIIYGNVFDKDSKHPLEATISYHDLTSGKEAGVARSAPSDGSYKIILPFGEAYGFLASKENYLSERDHIDLKEKKEFLEIHRDLYLSPVESGKSITLNNVFFVRSMPELLPESYTELEQLVEILKNNPRIRIQISGHTDNVGDQEKNMALSLERAKRIKAYLISKGIAANRIEEKGYGGTKPVASNAKEETRKLNRRVEFTILP